MKISNRLYVPMQIPGCTKRIATDIDAKMMLAIYGNMHTPEPYLHMQYTQAIGGKPHNMIHGTLWLASATLIVTNSLTSHIHICRDCS